MQRSGSYFGLFYLGQLAKARSAENGPPLRGAKRHGCFGATLCASCARLRPNACSAVSAPGFALLAEFGIILKLFLVKEELLALGKDKVFPTGRTLQYTIGKFHGSIRTEKISGDGHAPPHCPPVPWSRLTADFHNFGPGPLNARQCFGPSSDTKCKYETAVSN